MTKTHLTAKSIFKRARISSRTLVVNLQVTLKLQLQENYRLTTWLQLLRYLQVNVPT